MTSSLSQIRWELYSAAKVLDFIQIAWIFNLVIWISSTIPWIFHILQALGYSACKVGAKIALEICHKSACDKKLSSALSPNSTYQLLVVWIYLDFLVLEYLDIAIELLGFL